MQQCSEHHSRHNISALLHQIKMFSEFSQMKIQLDSKKLKRKMLKNFIENYLKKIAKQVKSKAAILYISSTQQSRNSIK